MSGFGNGSAATVSTELPDSISFDNSDLDRDMIRRQLRPNTWYRGKCANASVGVWPKGSLFLETQWAPINAEGQVKSPYAKSRLTLPFINKNRPDMKVPGTIDMCHEFLQGIQPSAPQNAAPELQEAFKKAAQPYPTYNRDDGTWVTSDGQPVNKETAKSAEREIKKAVREVFSYYYSNPKELVGEYSFFLTEDNDYRGVSKVAVEPPDGVTVQMTDLIDPNAT